MSCLSPIYMRPPTPEEVKANGNKWIYGGKNPKLLFPVDPDSGEAYDFIPVPCGQCLACRLAYSREWANRIVCESFNYSKDLCWFITLTYSPDSEYLLLNEKGILSLRRKHIQDFKKRLRSYYKRNFNHIGIRTFECGEYGSRTFRPHFHIICFNLPIDDKEYFFTNELGDLVYKSALIEELWGYGQISIGELNYKTASYTARYVMKKQKGYDAQMYADMDITPPFVSMSLRPGIGADYCAENMDEIYSNDKLYLPMGRVVSPSRYFDKKFALEHGQIELDRIKAKRRKLMALQHEYELFQTNLTEDDYFKVKEEKLNNNAKKLIRALD